MIRWRNRGRYLALLAGVVGLDQFTKILVDRLMEVHESREIVAGLADLTYVRNRGAAFGILSDAQLPFQPLIFGLVGVVALMAIVGYALRLPAENRLPQVALALVMGGAVGNLIDRARLGYVIDFVDVYWNGHHWPAFNVADSAISVGVVLLVVDMIWRKEDEPESATSSLHAAGSPSGSD